MTAPEPVRFSEVWVGQQISEYGNPKKYRVVSIMLNPDRVAIKAIGGFNHRTVLRKALEISWFPAGATPAQKEEEA